MRFTLMIVTVVKAQNVGVKKYLIKTNLDKEPV